VALGASLIAMNDTAQVDGGIGGIEGFDIENSGRLSNSSPLFYIFNF
jgi:hypothetical protein